jgi:CheY-like chemotaxis protein
MAVSVLIVDDDAGFRRTAAELLRARGFVLAGEAANRDEAVAAVRRTRPVAILLDVHLPDGDGLELVAELLAAIGRAPLILLTSSDSRAATDEGARQCGAVGFVAKAELPDADLTAYFTGEVSG